MPTLETKHEFSGSIAAVFRGIRSYEQYSNYIPGVTYVEVLPAQHVGSSCQVRYELNIVKKIYYVLNMFEDTPNKISWNLAESNVMKKNDGAWILSEISKNKTLAIYQLDVAFRGLVPSALTNKIAKTSLPGMFEGMQKLITEIT